MRKILVSWACVFGVLLGSTAFAAEPEFGTVDGLSDPNLISINDGDLNWSYQDSTGGYAGAVSLGTLGENGEHVITGFWSGGTTSEIGTAKRRNNGDVRWSIQDLTGGTQTVDFGKKSDRHLISGGDFNGNGSTDAARITKVGTAEIYVDMFNGGSVLTGFTFTGKEAKRGKAFFVNANGLNDILAVYYFNKRQRKLITVDASGAKSSVKFPKRKNKPVDVMPIGKEDGTDNILVFEKKKKKRFIRVYDLAGTLVHSATATKNDTVIVGNYLADAGQEYGVYDSKTGVFTITNPTTNAQTQYTLQAGQVIADQVNVFSFRSNSSGGTVGGGGGGAGCSGGILGSPPGGVLWKPHADASDAREGKPVVLYTGGRKPGGGSIGVYASNGTQICNFTFKASSIPGINGGADHYFSGWSGGCAKNCSAINAAARAAAGNTTIRFTARNGACYTISNACGRFGGI